MDAIQRNHNRSKLHNLLITPLSMEFTDSGYPIMKQLDVSTIDATSINLRRFNNAMSDRTLSDKIVHFYIEDYQFERIWAQPDRYLPMLQRAEYVVQPDFSMFYDMPLPVQMFNHYRNQWLGAYWQHNGISVIPNMSWSNNESFSWCFDGVPTGGVIMVSTVGAMRSMASRQRFIEGYNKMLDIVQPEIIICRTDKDVQLDGNVTYIEANRKE